MNWAELNGIQVPEGMIDGPLGLRSFIQDHKRRNRLLGGAEQLSREQLAACLKLSLDDWNETPPLGDHFVLETHPSVLLLFLYSAVHAHRMIGQVQTANQVTYTDGGLNLALSDKTALNQSWMQASMSEYEQKKRQWKTSRNLEQMYGAEWSEYSDISGSRGGV